MSYRGILRTLLVRGGKQELPSQHQSVARASLHMPVAQYQHNNSTSASWAWPRALGEPEVAHGRSHAVAAWRRGGVALLLCFCGVRSYEHFQQLMDVDRALPTRRPRSMGASVPVAHARVPATSRLRCAPPPREPFASFACLVRTRGLQLGMEQSNIDVEAACLARRTWRLLAVLFVLCSRAFSYLANESCARRRGFAWCGQEKDATKVGFTKFGKISRFDEITGGVWGGHITAVNISARARIWRFLLRLRAASSCALLGTYLSSHPSPPPSAPPRMIASRQTAHTHMIVWSHTQLQYTKETSECQIVDSRGRSKRFCDSRKKRCE